MIAAPGTDNVFCPGPTMDVLLPYRTSFFRRVVKDLLESRVLRTDMRVLVTCAGRADRDVLAEAGFSGVTR